jgi:uncharacterized protein (TIGR02246 family)
MSDAPAVRHLLDRLVAAWNDGDAAAYAGLFVEDADYVTFFGHNMAGRAAIEEGHRALFQGPLKGSRLAVRDAPKIRFLTPDVAVVLASGGSPGGDGQESVITLTAVRHGADWRFGSFQNTRRTPPPGAAS